MQFLYHPDSGSSKIEIEGEPYRYIFKVRRHREGERIALRNLQDQFIYFYKIESVTRRKAELLFLEKEKKEVKSKEFVHLAWCVIDPKVVEKTLPTLNEIGVEKISFIYCDRSQKNFKLDFDRLTRIAINSSQQCGRSSLIKFEMIDSIDSFFQKYPESAVFDFGGKLINCNSKVKSILVGCEGGFSDQERVLFKDRLVFSLNTPLILRSESAAIVATTKIFL